MIFAPWENQRGFALIGVLWIVVLLAVVGLDFSLRSRTMTRRVMNAADHSVATAAAEAGLLFAEDALRSRLRRAEALGPNADAVVDPWAQPDLLVDDSLDIGDAVIRLRLEDVGARLNLNRAGEAELRSLMTALRVDAGQADRAAQAMADWRDLDDSRRGRGAELQEYLQDDAPVLPSNGPFGSVDEIRLVLGVTPEVSERLAPFLTVAGSGRVNLSAAPVEVIAALPGMSTELLAAILGARREAGRVPDLLSLTTGMSAASRERIWADLPTLLQRVTTETEEVLVTVLARRRGTNGSAQATAVAVRGGGFAFLVDRSIR